MVDGIDVCRELSLSIYCVPDNWSPDAIRCLIQEYIDRKDIMTDSTKPKIKEFIKIANEIHKKYPPLEGKGLVVQRKWRKLVNA